ncbi:MAG: hypothetical protein KIT22_14945, partial [Verrucomicrobiae bacterium]|nr:hypothetical protein [Verrucomicrobiae bacterium]
MSRTTVFLAALALLAGLAYPAISAAGAADGPDLDGDGLPDLVEVRFGSDPTRKDTDSDGWDDKAEFEANTNPRDPNIFPIFTLLARDRQLLEGDLLVLRARAFTNAVVVTNVTITPGEGGVPVDADGDGTPEGCDFDGDGVADVEGECPVDGIPVTNEVLVTNYVSWQWYHGENVLETQTNESLVIHLAGTNESGLYHLEASYLTSKQTSAPVAAEVLPWRARLRLPQPVGDVVSWGLDDYGQIAVPNTVTQVLAVAAGLGHSAVIRTDG